MLGVQRQDLGDLDRGRRGRDRLERAANLGRRVGLHVQDVELAGCAEVEDHDHASARRDPWRDRPLGLGGHESAQRKADRAQRADLQKVAARDAVARVRSSPTR